MNRFKSELRKIWTIRSTYALTLIMILLGAGVFAFFAFGFKNVDNADKGADVLLNALRQPLGVVALLLSILSIISVGHEYRYNTILYSLTSAKQRLAVLASKLAALLVSSLLITGVVAVLSFAGFYIGQSIAGINTVPQSMPNAEFILQMLVQMAAYVVIGFGIAVILRSLVGAIAVMLIVPSTIEQLLGLLLKDNTRYLPFTALNNLVEPTSRVATSTSLMVVIGYVAVLLAIGAFLFQRRDAN